MRSFALILLATFTMVTRTPAQSVPGAGHPADAKTRAELVKARDVIWRAWFAGDKATLDRVLAGALAAGDHSDGWSDRAGAIAESQEFAKAGGKLIDLQFDSTHIVLHGTVAVVTSRYSYTTTGGPTGGRSTTRGQAVEIFVLEKGAWTHPFWHLARLEKGG